MRSLSLKSLAPFLAGLLLVTGIFPGGVFCVGDDGHQALELISDGCCHPGVIDADYEAESDHCSSSCRDTAMVGEALLAKAGDTEFDIESSASPGILPAALRSEARRFSRYVLSENTGQHVPITPRERHTTVHLC